MNTQQKFIIACLEAFSSNGTVDIFDKKLIYDNEVLDICRQQRVLPIVSAVLKKSGYDSELITQGEIEAAMIAFTSTMRLKRCKEVFRALNQANIPYALIKGLYLAKEAYGKFDLRGSGDIDLLISKKDIKKISKIMDGQGLIQGYVSSDTKQVIEYTREAKVFYLLDSHSLAPYVKLMPDGLSCVEMDINFSLTWGEDKKLEIDVEDFLSDCREIDLFGEHVPVLSPEKSLLQICMHHYKESASIFYAFTRQDINLLKICDIYFYVKRNLALIDWDNFYRIVYKYSLEMYISCMFHYIEEMFPGFMELTPIKSFITHNTHSHNKLIDRLGLGEEEKVMWPICFSERVFCTDRFSLIEPFLPAQYIDKIANNKIYIYEQT